MVDDLFRNLPPKRKRRFFDDEDTRGMDFREMFTLQREGPLRPRPSGKGGPSVNQGTTPPPTSVWSAADAAANGAVLSNGGLTVTPTTGAFQTVRGTNSRASGKYYVEFLATVAGTITTKWFGVASSSFIPTSILGTTDYSASVRDNRGTYVSAGFTGNYSSSLGATQVNGDVWALAIDFSTGSIWIAQNNVWDSGGGSASNPATGSLPILSFVAATVGALFPGISFGDWGLVSGPSRRPPPARNTPRQLGSAHGGSQRAKMMKRLSLAFPVALIALLAIAPEPAYAVRCAAGVYRAGCVGPRGGFVTQRRYVHPYARRCVWRAGRRIC